MSLAPCRECGQEVSSEAASCPNCGAHLREGQGGTDPLMKGRGKADLALFVMLLLVLGGIVLKGC